MANKKEKMEMSVKYGCSNFQLIKIFMALLFIMLLSFPLLDVILSSSHHGLQPSAYASDGKYPKKFKIAKSKKSNRKKRKNRRTIKKTIRKTKKGEKKKNQKLQGLIKENGILSADGKPLSHQISERILHYLSEYSPDSADYVVKKELYPGFFVVLSERFSDIKNLMREVVEVKMTVELSKIDKFFDEKMRPFAEVENLRREELMRALKRYIKVFPNSPLTPYAILRYAEIYYEKLNYDYMRAYEEALLKGEPPPPKDLSPVVKIYEDFLKKYKNFPRRDAVMYLAGYVLDEMGYSLDAIEKYFEPLARIRISSFAPEAAMRCGEFWFNSGDLDRAEEFYLIVLDFPQHPLYTKALYKLAWTYYRKGEYDVAIDYFVETIEASGEKEKQTGLVKEAVDYIVASVVELGGFEKLDELKKEAVISALQKLYKEPEIFILEGQGKTYFNQGKYNEAILTYRKLIDKFYESERSIKAAFGIADSLKKLGDIPSLIAWQVKVAEMWGPQSLWAKKNPEEYKKHARKIEKELLESAKYYHEKNMVEEAESAYLLFLKLFPKSQKSAETQFLLAELYFSLQRYIDAYNMYKAVVENEYVKENPYLIDAAWGMVISADEALKQGRKEAPSLLKNASFLFERLFPLDGRVPIALYKAARVLGQEGKTKEALLILRKIIQKYPGASVVADSLLEIIKIYVDSKMLDKVVSFSLKARKRRDILSQKDIDYINELGSKALFKIAKNHEEAKEYEKAITLYLSIEKLYPDSQYIDDALYNVVMINFELKKFNDVLKYSEIFLTKFPKSDFRYDVIFARATALANLFFFDEAITTYVRVVEELEEKEKQAIEKERKKKRKKRGRRRRAKNKEQEKKKKYLSDIEYDMLKQSYKSIIDIYAGLGRFEKAAEWALRYFNKFGEEEENPEYFLKLAADYYKEAGKIKTARRILQRFINEKRKKEKDISAEIIIAKYEIANSHKWEMEQAEKKIQEIREKIKEIRKEIRELRRKRGINPERKKKLIERKKKRIDYLKKSIKNYREFIDKKRKIYEKMLAELIELYEDLDSERDKKRTLRIYAEAKFYFAKKIFDDFKKIRISSRDRKKALARKLKRKTELLKKIQEEMMKIARLGDPEWTFAALFHIGYAFQDFADMLINAPLPPEIRRIRDPEERMLAEAIYREELEKQAFPLEDQAIQIYRKAIERAKSTGIRNKWIAMIFKNLKVIDPLAPVETEDDRSIELDVALSMRTDEMPEIEEEEKKGVFVAKRETNVFELTRPETLKNFMFEEIGNELFSHNFAFSSEDGKIKLINIYR